MHALSWVNFSIWDLLNFDFLYVLFLLGVLGFIIVLASPLFLEGEMRDEIYIGLAQRYPCVFLIFLRTGIA